METGMRHIYKTKGTHAYHKWNNTKSCVMFFEACDPAAAWVVAVPRKQGCSAARFATSGACGGRSRPGVHAARTRD